MAKSMSRRAYGKGAGKMSHGMKGAMSDRDYTMMKKKKTKKKKMGMMRK